MTTTALDPYAPATAMLRALRARQLSAVELLDLHLQRIERYNPTLNAIVTPAYDTAREAARAADTSRARGDERPLLGLPLTIKDCIDVAGLRGTAGVPEFAERRAAADALVVARLRAAGGVIVGKTNVPPWAADWQASNPLFGRTVNPWDHRRTPGGSSGGGAAALAAGLSALDLGSDMAGSIRVPAAFCGIYGHRPSETVVPCSGHFPGALRPNPARALGVLGPLARSADDLALALTVLAGPAAGEEVGWRLTLPPPRHACLADYRVALLPPLDWLPVNDEIVAALDGLASSLRQYGVRVELAHPDGFGDLRRHHERYLALMEATASADAPPEERRQRAAAARTRAASDPFATATACGLEAGAADYLHWFEERERDRAAYRAFFRDWDILLTPMTCSLPFPHTDAPWEARTLAVNGRTLPYDRAAVYPGLATFSGQPATAFPIGLSRAGLPLGAQAIGPYLEDQTPIHFSALVAEAWAGFRPPPGYS